MFSLRSGRADRRLPVTFVEDLRGGGVWYTSVAISPDGRWLVTSSERRTAARLWDLTAKDPDSSAIILSGHEGGILSVAISPDGRWVVTGSNDNTACLWDLRAEDPQSSPLVFPHAGSVLSVAISEDGRWLTTGAAEVAQLWDLTAADPTASSLTLRGHDEPIESMAFSHNGRWLVTGSADTTARLWDLNIDSLIDRARRLAGRELTQQERTQYMVPGP